MMGKVTDTDQFVRKTTTGLIALPADHVLLTRRELPIEAILKRCVSACTQCSYCTDMCPRYLIGHRLRPNLTMRAAAFGWFEEDSPAMDALICCECGICETSACNMGLSPMRINMMIKKKFAENGIKFRRSDGELKAHEYRSGRKTPIRNIMQRTGLLEWYGQKTPYRGELASKRVEIDLRQHIGAPCVPIVKDGDKVTVGQLVGEVPDGKLGSPVHASISGTVKITSGMRIGIEA